MPYTELKCEFLGREFWYVSFKVENLFRGKKKPTIPYLRIMGILLSAF